MALAARLAASRSCRSLVWTYTSWVMLMRLCPSGLVSTSIGTPAASAELA